MKNKKQFSAAALMLLGSTAASAAVNVNSAGFTYNFADIADKTALPFDWGNNPEGETGGPSLTFTEPTSNAGPGLTAYGYQNADSIDDAKVKPAAAFLESGNAGLGVCGNLNSGLQCHAGNNGAIANNGMLKLVFTSAVSINDIFFKIGSKNSDSSGSEGNRSLGFYINGVFVNYSLLESSDNNLNGYLNFSELTALGLGNPSDTWTFLNLNKTSDPNHGFYLSSISGVSAVNNLAGQGNLSSVPLPAAAWFMLSGLMAFFGVSSRRKN